MTAGQRLLSAALRADAARPRVVHYDLAPAGMRVELGGKALAMWATKTANLLVEEEVEGPVALELPVVHWRTVTWLLGCWVAGLEPVGASAAAAGLRVVAAPLPANRTAATSGSAPGGPVPLLGALDLAALARSAGELPAGVLDLNTEIQAQPDQLVVPPSADEAELPVPRRAGRPVTTAELTTLGAHLVAALEPTAPRPLVLVSGSDDAAVLARVAADERLV